MICPDIDDDLEIQRNPNPENRTEWHSCCFLVDRDVVVFFTKYFILVSLMIFFAYELHISEDCNDKQLFNGLLMLVFGVALPNPKLKN